MVAFFTFKFFEICHDALPITLTLYKYLIFIIIIGAVDKWWITGKKTAVYR
jgi:hypothetical protein